MPQSLLRMIKDQNFFPTWNLYSDSVTLGGSNAGAAMPVGMCVLYPKVLGHNKKAKEP